MINFAFLVARPIQQVFSALKSNHRVVFALDRLTWRHVCANKAVSDGVFFARISSMFCFPLACQQLFGVKLACIIPAKLGECKNNLFAQNLRSLAE